MTDLNHVENHINENGKHVDWTYIEWLDEDMGKTADAHTQTSPKSTVDKETQTSNPFLMRIELSRTSSRLRCGSLSEVDAMPTPLFQFDRQAPARISTSPTLRRMRSARLPCLDAGRINNSQEEPGVTESVSPRSPLSPAHRQKSPLATTVNQDNEDDNQNNHCNDFVTPGKDRLKTLSSSDLHLKQEFLSVNESADADEDTEEVKETVYKRLQERRRSSEVVTLPGLDVSPGDLFVSNGALDILHRSTFSDTKKSKWPFSKRTMNKSRTRIAADIEKCLTTVQIQEWQNTHFQQYKDLTLEEFLRSQPALRAEEEPKAHKRQEALWELFTSECVYFLDQLMVLKEVFLSTLSDLQMRECLQDIDSWALFANLNELCLVSFGFLTSLLRVIKEMWATLDPPESSSPQALPGILKKAFGESICHCLQKYCLNYSKAILYLDTLKTREDFSSYVKWCEKKEQCRRLQLRDLLVTPLQRFTRYPLILKNMEKRSCTEAEERALNSIVELVDKAIDDLEGKVKWLDNYQKVKQLKEALIWLPMWERDKRAHVPENLKHLLKAVALENLVSQRNLRYEGKLTLTENSKVNDVHLFLFDEFLLITKIKRNKKRSVAGEIHSLRSAAGQELEQLLQEGCSVVVLDQPISLDRLQLRNIDQFNATASGLPCSFIIMHQNRYQQCIGVFILQAPTEAVKKAWLSEIEEAVGALLKRDSQQPRLKSSSVYVESSQI